MLSLGGERKELGSLRRAAGVLCPGAAVLAAGGTSASVSLRPPTAMRRASAISLHGWAQQPCASAGNDQSYHWIRLINAPFICDEITTWLNKTGCVGSKHRLELKLLYYREIFSLFINHFWKAYIVFIIQLLTHNIFHNNYISHSELSLLLHFSSHKQCRPEFQCLPKDVLLQKKNCFYYMVIYYWKLKMNNKKNTLPFIMFAVHMILSWDKNNALVL